MCILKTMRERKQKKTMPNIVSIYIMFVAFNVYILKYTLLYVLIYSLKKKS